jgi:predicted DCC family thiol-disulfide oxidoreductase YuxK
MSYLKSLQTITTKLTIFYDGECPLCLAEIHFLKQHNQHGLLAFISLQQGDLADSDIKCELALKTIHAKLGEHEMIIGPEVFYEAYKRTDLKFVNYLFSLKSFRFIYARFYVIFAKYRHQISKLIGPCMLRLVQKKYPTNPDS